MLNKILFISLVTASILFFIRNVKKLIRNIKLGKITPIFSRKERLKRMFFLAFGQSKMVFRPVAGVLHFVVYLGFFIVNIEVIEIILDGILGTHRFFADYLGAFYFHFITFLEGIAVAVIGAISIFFIRRNILKINRFQKKEINKSARKDANTILFFEAILMTLFLVMNACDILLQEKGLYPSVGKFPISACLTPLFSGVSGDFLIFMERSCWWLHIIGIFLFLNYLYYSKHLHILLAFPYTYFADIQRKGEMKNMKSITQEVKLMLNIPTEVTENQVVEKFGASDIFDFTRVQLLSAYTCTECGRCTDECPANKTGKLLSPRKIMMNVRDRIEEIGENIDKNKTFIPDGKQLLNDYISPEELWACTSCNACVQACPLEINPLSIILEMRRYLVMEQSQAPAPLTMMMTQLENSGSPWGYSNEQRDAIFS